MVATVIDNEVSVILNSQVVSLLSFVPSIRRPSWLVVSIIDNQVTIILHSQSVGSSSLSVGATCPKSILGNKVRSVVENEVTISLESSIVTVVGCFNGLTSLEGLSSSEVLTKDVACSVGV